MVAAAALGLAGGVSMFIFILGLLFDTRKYKQCCPTLLSCYPCDNPPPPPYWPLFVAIFFFVASGSLLLLDFKSKPE
jgi:hypothetical protein